MRARGVSLGVFVQDTGWLDFGWFEWEAGWLVVAGPGVLLVDG